MDEQLIIVPEDKINTDITEWLQTIINETAGNFIISFEETTASVTDQSH